jgi:hypothetical protein
VVSTDDPSFVLDERINRAATLYLGPDVLAPGSKTQLKIAVNISGGCDTPVCPARSTSIITIESLYDELQVYVSGGTMRTIGNTETTTLSAVAVGNSVPSYFKWTCVDATHIQVLIGLGSSLTIDGPDLLGPKPWLSAVSVYTCTVVAAFSADSPTQANASVELRLIAGSPLAVTITASATGKLEPSQRLQLFGTIDAPTGTELEMNWVASVLRDGQFLEVVLTTTGLTSNNLVVQAAQLVQGNRYKFVVHARTSDREGFSAVEFDVNKQPKGGRIVCSPSTGMASRDTFHLTTEAWVDDDLPLAYRFGIVSNSSGSTSYLTNFGAAATAAILTTGQQANGYRMALTAEAMDTLGGVGLATTLVQVEPFVPPTGERLSNSVSALLRSQSSAGNSLAVGQIVASIASSLNEESGSNVSDVRETRNVLMGAIEVAGGILTSAMVGNKCDACGQLIDQVAAVVAIPEQLSTNTTDKAFAFVASLTSQFGPSLELPVISGIANTMSKLLDASEFEYSFSTMQNATNTSNQLQSDTNIVGKKARAKERGDVLELVIGSLGSNLAASMLPGEEELELKTKRFGMFVQQDSPTAFEGRVIGGGRVAVPIGALSNANAPVCDLDAGTDDTADCPAGCTSVGFEAATCTGGTTEVYTCDLDTDTDGTAVCPADCTDTAQVDASCTAVADTPTCDLDATTDAHVKLADGSPLCPAGCTTDQVEESCSGASDDGSTCDLDGSTDGTADCPTGCTAVAFSAATACTGVADTPACDMDAGTDGTAACPAGCTDVSFSAASCTGTSTQLITCDLDASTDGNANCVSGCTDTAEVDERCTGVATPMHGAVSSSVVAWDGPGHLYWAVGNSDNNENSTRGSTTLASSLLSVSFSRGGVEISVKGLTQGRFVITLTMSEDEKYGRRRLAGRIGCRSLECAYWDVAQDKFIADGVLLYRSDDGLSINCSYTHLTAFGGMAGDTAVYIHFVATKLRNAYKFNAVFLSLRRADQRNGQPCGPI